MRPVKPAVAVTTLRAISSVGERSHPQLAHVTMTKGNQFARSTVPPLCLNRGCGCTVGTDPDPARGTTDFVRDGRSNRVHIGKDAGFAAGTLIVGLRRLVDLVVTHTFEFPTSRNPTGSGRLPVHLPRVGEAALRLQRHHRYGVRGQLKHECHEVAFPCVVPLATAIKSPALRDGLSALRHPRFVLATLVGHGAQMFGRRRFPRCGMLCGALHTKIVKKII